VDEVGTAALLLAAGVLGGVASSSGAIGSLVSYPALLAVGVPPLTANVTNAVAVTGVGVSASLRSRPELQGSGNRLVRWAVVAAVGAAVGAVLLLVTPPGVFARVVPFLVLAAAVLMLLQPRLTRARGGRAPRRGGVAFTGGLFGVAVYEGYFGAGAGVMTLALALLTVEVVLPRANALKNLLLGVADLVAGGIFAVVGAVDWSAAVPLGVGFLLGGAVGPTVVRRLPAGLLRVLIAAAAVVLATWLLVSSARG
jgi:uncharacterized membrane protein YfcA